MPTGPNIEQQAGQVSVRIRATLRSATVRAVNAGAHHLRALAIQASSGAGSGRKGKRLWQSIKIQSATYGNPVSVVYLDTGNSGVPHAAAVHENYNGYRGIHNKSGGKYLYIPQSLKGANNHELHAHDTDKLRGWISDGPLSRPVGMWSKSDLASLKRGTRVPIDFLLKRSVNIPPSPRAGFLTRTARVKWRSIQSVMRNVIDQELGAARP